MKTAIFVLLVVCVAGLLVGTPAAADEQDRDREKDCWKIYTNPPGVVIDPECVKDMLPPPK